MALLLTYPYSQLAPLPYNGEKWKSLSFVLLLKQGESATSHSTRITFDNPHVPVVTNKFNIKKILSLRQFSLSGRDPKIVAKRKLRDFVFVLTYIYMLYIV
jgi:hypothetical protein